MEEIINILNEINDEVDYENCETLIEDGHLTSFEMVFLISQISAQLGVTIPANEIVPENFNSVKQICALIKRLED